ncbi:MAG: Ig-like domain-containing protein [Deltaproteobacteria bacterium]|nr:Ig-like domain-containing protein [Deltaproteobacteria bacterium]
MKKILFLFLMIAGCGWQDANQIAPSIDSTSPTNGAGGFALNQAITATFNATMDSATISTSTFTIGNVAGTVSLDSTKKIATFTPSSNLTASTLYTATITTGAKNTNGIGLTSNYVWTFMTGSSSTPTVSSTTPASGATAVPTNQAISATFSNVMDSTTITTTTFSVAGVTGTIAMDATKKIATFTPIALLTANTKFTATISTGVKDSNGNALQSASTWSFTTGN